MEPQVAKTGYSNLKHIAIKLLIFKVVDVSGKKNRLGLAKMGFSSGY
jgi:hypothetical protein